MRVQGIQITQAQIDACLARMKEAEFFRFHEIVGAAMRAKVPHEARDRLADRLIQRERKAGRIMPANRSGLWKQASPSTSEASQK